MDSIVAVFTEIPGTKTKADDDAIDRLSNKYTVIIIVAFAIVVGAGVFFSSPITCWAPQHFTGAHTSYANAYCWVRNTYYLPFEDEIPAEHEEEKRNYLPYYQWIPFILLIQALGFYMPSVLWHAYNQTAGVDADTILDMSNTFNKAEGVDVRDNTLQIIRNQMDRFLRHRSTVLVKKPKKTLRDKLREGSQMSTKGFGCYLILLYIFTKILYLVNVIAQLFILNSILAVEYSVYGIEVFRWMLDNYDWTTSPQVAFPRVTMCDFKLRRLGNVHRYTVQCALPINLYNEKIYMFLWFWMVFVALCTAISLVTWILRLALKSDRQTYIQNHLKMLRKLNNDNDKDRAINFTKSYLRQDGVFLLRLIGHNTNTLTVSEIIGALWDNWKGPDHNGGVPAMEMAPTTEKEPMLEKEK